MDSYAQNHDLSEMTENARNRYLTKLAKEVTNNFGPGWLQGNVSASVSPLQEFDNDGDYDPLTMHLGRKYYKVTFTYDEKTKKEIGWEYASIVSIWEDSGEPMDVILGLNYRHFLDKPYREFVKEGIGPTDQVKFEKMYIPEWMKFRLMTEEERKEYLIKKAIEVTQNFGPGWYRESVVPIVSDQKVFDESIIPKSQPNIRKYPGRKYYIVRLDFDEETRKKYVWSHASEVRIWADDGEPFMITFGNTFGVNFYSKSYHQWLEDGISDEYKNFFDEYTMEEFQKDIQPMIEMAEASREAQSHYLSNMTEEARNEYLVKKAKEVALAFAPEWMQWEVTPQVSPKQKYFSNNQRQDIQKNVGREYYAVTFYYNDETKAKIKYDYAATVRIWADSGEVADIGAGDWVKAFLDTSCEQMKKEGIKPEDQLHFEPIDGKLALSQMTEEARNEYLLKKSKEVVLNFGPEWYQEPMTTTIRGPVAYHAMDSRSQKYNGRQCYFVSYYYDKYKDTEFSRAFTVCIWEEDGEPEGILYGNEHGQAFFGSYNKMVKDGAKKEHQMPFDKGHYDHKDIYTDY
ncbi:MAG: hypothetical protein K5899_08170 [Bacteroidaceae bacterium]|nr:hypothetical protein [Bacteroidaceae bacterium]